MSMRGAVRRLTPEFVLRLRARWRSQRKMGAVRDQGSVTGENLLGDLRALGLVEGDVVLVHSSLSRLGYVEGGARTVLDCLLKCVGSTGTLVLPTYSLANSMVNQLSEPGYLFDPGRTPSQMGRLSEIFRCNSGVERSVHPTHSVAAFGPQAIAITERRTNYEDNFGEGSPFDRIQGLGGKTVGLGVDYSVSTFYHVFEDMNPGRIDGIYLPDRVTAKFIEGGQIREAGILCHAPERHARRIDKDPEIERAFARHFRATGLAHEGPVGRGRGWWMNASELLSELGVLCDRGMTIYGLPGEQDLKQRL